MSGPFGSSTFNHGVSAGGVYNDVVNQSLRFEDSRSNVLSKTLSASNGTIFTFSCWVKLGNIGINRCLLQGYEDSNNFTQILLYSSNQVGIYSATSNTARLYTVTTALQRDHSSWYNIVVKFNGTSGSEEFKIYVNGVNQALTTTTALSAHQSLIGNSNAHYIGNNFNQSLDMDGYMAEVNFIDGTALDASSFGETNDGIWVPKDTSGLTFGTNGFRLQFNQTGLGTASASTIGADISGNANHFTSTNIIASDCNMPDCPENNFAVMNQLTIGDGRVHSGAVYHEGNLKVACGGFSTSTIGGGFSSISIPKDKKIYCEVYEPNQDANLWGAGVIIDNHVQNSTQLSGNGGITYYNRSVFINGTENDYGSSGGIGGLGVAKLTAGDVLGIAVDGATGKVWFHRNGTYFGEPQGSHAGAGTTGNPSAGTNEIGTITNTTAINTSGEIFIILTGNGSVDDLYVNFGQDSTFSGNKTAGTNTDAEGRGLFLYPVPTDYLALCSANLTDSEIGPNQSDQADDHFNTVLYTGNSGTQSITGVGFSPDWLWVKNRGTTYSHALVDSVRGATLSLSSDSTAVERTSDITSLDSDGFSLQFVNATGSYSENQGTQNYVAWNWKAGTAFSNDASATGVGTIDSAGQVNTKAGFSIIGYTGNGTDGATVAHGLSETIEALIVKRRDGGTAHWQYHDHSNSAGKVILFSDDAAEASYSGFQNGGLDNLGSATFSLEDGSTNGDNVNASGDNFIAYCFHSVEGYSKVASFLGNGNANGRFVYCGFRPAWVLIRQVTQDGNWNIIDDTRQTFNDGDGMPVLRPDSNAAEEEADTMQGQIDILSNGFKLRANNSSYNTSGATILYLAFADSPFKYANAR